MPEIITDIKDGLATVTVKGVKGARCKELTRPFEKLGRVKSDQPTKEMKEKPLANKINRG